MFELLAASACLGCEAPSATDFCPDCASEWEQPARRMDCRGTAFTAAMALGDYAGVQGRLVRAAKFRLDERAASRLASRFALEIRAEGLAFDVVVPVPTTPWRRLFRGFHLPDVLAESAASASQPRSPVLRRRWGSAQSALPVSGRSAAAKSRFEAIRAVAGRVLLVDDVATSGATAQSAALELLAHGAASVALAVAAASRGLPLLPVVKS